MTDLTTIAVIDLADDLATERLGSDLALILKPGDVVALIGDLGTGKTSLSRALIRALADDPHLEVPSPTFTLVQAYGGRVPVSHFDLYRLGDEADIEELGFEDALETGAAIVEWPQKVPAVLSRANIVIEFQTSEDHDGRRAAVAARGHAVQRVTRTLEIRTFLAGIDRAQAARRHLTGDASSRRYETILSDGADLVVMDSPRQADGPPIRDGLPYSQLVHLAEDVRPFVAVSRALRDAGFCAPSIIAQDLERGLLVTNNLGARTLLDDTGQPDPQRYRAAMEFLTALHLTIWSRDLPVDDASQHSVPDYDARAMMIEAELLVDWYVPDVLGRKASADERDRFAEAWSMAFSELADTERSLVLRDFHSPNILWQPDAIGTSRIGVIDFQDAMIGPTAYDVASLAQDARVAMSPELEASLVAAYVAARRKDNPDFNAFFFERDYAVMAAQRATKILGIFVRLAVRDGKPNYRRHMPHIISYLKRTLDHPTLSAVKSLYSDWGIVEKH
ncbi:tRNA (adenosine(37)-N6)-threonylcarbamoyltransferase complex ATPase subunit type 1 TsaE [Fulvimarina sp. 2208YS6-2-32]|uniref:tRNA threonylcarbamoyladenosine biosynthesis protein TsaE n=1 Tax=Fulvimarina uroteuthidis TaxID=3098149 RepID=A0ABU5I6S1_9HYPH|nr:tRNA (adenosine(37)-N6)-threonylcarbamoyltransferase complex ATPase subunit type 1 TsaE [Fulvimarina sp. 2208YS6-2-32]MDY8110514.1 tRNA (adenosine(37)-N6)-threonylcarbamoyltransferase complex ATPase subunit type 1 TsaE [Fulvimarina sp. 2208YS6-2-32]